jgi:hypothetical protein
VFAIDEGVRILSAPKVFVSHASDDKDRFVRNLAERLRANGVDIWLDEWEINAGDNPVQKIFEEGLKECQAIILIMSATSVQKPWVRAELDQAFVKRVEGRTNLIPIRLDDCDMPECLLTTRWESVDDCADYDAVFVRVLNSIFGHYPRPPLGSAPAYAEVPSIPIASLDRIDSLVFERACRIAIEQGHSMINAEDWLKSVENLRLSDQRLADSQEVLDEDGCIKLFRTIGPAGTIYSFSVTPEGFDDFSRVCLPGFVGLFSKVAACLANADPSHFETGNSLASEFGEPLRVIEHILEMLELHGLIEIVRMNGGPHMTVCRVSSKLKRAASEGL